MEEELTSEKLQSSTMIENLDEISSIDTGVTMSIDPKQHQTFNDSQSLSSGGLESTNSLTYYYSSFDLFENNNPAFLKYRRFISKLQIYLGPDWMMYANRVVFREGQIPGTRQYYENSTIFEVCLEIWLQMRRDFNRDRKNLGDSPSSIGISQQMAADIQASLGETDGSKIQEIIFSMFEENEIFEQFSRQFASSFTGCLMDEMTYKPVLHGFFLSAVETWNYILRNPTRKREKTDSFKQVIDEYKKKIIKPIMIVSQKLTGIFGQTTNNQKQSTDKGLLHADLNENILRSFKNFAKNINNEEEMMVEEMKKLDINASNSKQNSAQLPQTSSSSSQNCLPISQQTSPSVMMKKISETGDKAILDYAQSYLQTIVNDTQIRWQVARGFVTNIIELKYNDLQQYANNIKIRFLQPAQDFYNQLMDTYILFKSNNYTNIQFKDFLEKAKHNLGSKWNENLMIPTQVFFQTLIFQWNSILSENNNPNIDDETILRLFLQRVRARMADSWDENIVRKAQENISE